MKIIYLFMYFNDPEIIQRVKAHDDPPFRPQVSTEEVRAEIVHLMCECWSEDHEERPHFLRIVERLKKISGRYRYFFSDTVKPLYNGTSLYRNLNIPDS